jgi:energy-coupling factor transporter ATP-binding protein EcfA2
MTEYHSSPKLVYLQIRNIVNSLLEKVTTSDDEADQQGSNNLSYDILSILHNELTQKLESLEENAEWDTYTIAFYGETNAGKSTIIEALRLLLIEENKKVEQEKFKTWSIDSGCTQEVFEQLRNEIISHEDALNISRSEWKVEKEKLEEQRKKLLTEYNKQKFNIQKRKSRATYFKRFMWLFQTMPHLDDFKKADKELNAHQNIFAEKEKNTEEKHLHLKTVLNEKETRFNEILKRVKEAEHFADGRIIGNGRADFTNENHLYSFQLKGGALNIIDVPGIEGNEEKVSDEVSKAMQKAHAVVYVTSKAANAETGEDRYLGTFEKINQHLMGQAEVWSLYNKRISNPTAFTKTALLSDDEMSSLSSMDAQLKETLGSIYHPCIPVSAYPAFLGVAKCLLPGSIHLRSQAKFMASFSPDDLVEKSNIKTVMGFLNNQDNETLKHKINYANRKKAKQVAMDAINKVASLQNDTFAPLLDQLNQNALDIGVELDTSLMVFQHRLGAKIEEQIDGFEQGIRAKIYKNIDEEMTNDDFFQRLEAYILADQNTLKYALESLLEQHILTFYHEMQTIVERYQNQIGDLIGLYNSSYKVSFSLDAECNFIKQLKCFSEKKRLASFGLFQSAVSLFSHDLKKTNQKKSTDDNLHQILIELNSNIDVSLKELMEKLQVTAEEIKTAMSNATASIKEAQENLLIARGELHQLVEQLEAGK